MFQVKFDCKKKQHKQNESYEDFVVTFVKLFMKHYVFAVRINHNYHKSYKKTSCKNKLTLTEHILKFGAKLNIQNQKSVF